MTRRYSENIAAEQATAEPHRVAPSDREASKPHPLFDGLDPFEAEMM